MTGLELGPIVGLELGPTVGLESDSFLRTSSLLAVHEDTLSRTLLSCLLSMPEANCKAESFRISFGIVMGL